MKYRGIAFSGKMYSGKSTMMKAVQAELERAGMQTHPISFAEPVKGASKAVLVSLGLVDKDTPEEQWKAQFRHVPQVLGVSLRGYNQDVWIDLFKARCKSVDPSVVLLNDDCRFPNEADALREMGFYVVRLDADRDVRLRRAGGSLLHDGHLSETVLDGYGRFDLFLTVGHDSTVEQMTRSVLRGAGMLKDPMEAVP